MWYNTCLSRGVVEACWIIEVWAITNFIIKYHFHCRFTIRNECNPAVYEYMPYVTHMYA